MDQTQQKKMAMAADIYTLHTPPSSYGDFCAYDYRTIDWAKLCCEGGCYMFAKATGKTMVVENADGPCDVPLWHPLYVGETHNLGGDLPEHTQWQKAEDLGARHVIFEIFYDEMYRESVVEDWLFYFTPPLNKLDPDDPPKTFGLPRHSMMLV